MYNIRLLSRSNFFVVLVCYPVFSPRVCFEVFLDLRERLALGFGYEKVTEYPAQECEDGVTDEVGTSAVRVTDGLI